MAALLGSTLTAQAQRRFSPEAKGTVIGAGSGAILGAVIDKHNRGVGGIIGGVVGAGAGYAVGKHIDNRQKKRAAAASEAEREAAYREEAARRSAVASRTTTRETGVRSYGPAAGVAGATALAAGAAGTSLTASAANYLPNPAPADPANPYAGSPYRQRSW
ncbi:YMGG-like glycine zipper-containing protein [Hymenobacter baengnokdamensis]|uniref:YMGG-like glycine zipper-containing protein n=1 Tax=Hymenobacter baengnokdamensis TaxID=2615203 RepID=UPI001E2B2FA1|nr:YMGG-like glycine zipper-containing protein [Hymenobacter baengnokdamensis]